MPRQGTYSILASDMCSVCGDSRVSVWLGFKARSLGGSHYRWLTVWQQRGSAALIQDSAAHGQEWPAVTLTGGLHGGVHLQFHAALLPHGQLGCTLPRQPKLQLPQPAPGLQRGDLGCRALYGAPRVQPLNDYRLIYFVKKCLDSYIVSWACPACAVAWLRVLRLLPLLWWLTAALLPAPVLLCPPRLPQAKYRVMAACGDDVRLYSSPLIKFSKACTQVVSGRAWYLSGEQQCWSVSVGWPAAAATAGVAMSRCAVAAAAGLALRMPLLVPLACTC